MPRLLKTITILLVTMIMLGVISTRAVSAQMSPEQMLTQLDGLETAYARKYIADRELGFATPVAADAATPDVMLISVLEFGTEAELTEAFNLAMNGLAAQMLLGVPARNLDETEIDDLGDGALLYTATEETAHGTEHHALLAVQDDNVGFLIEAEGDDALMVETIKAVATFMVEAEPSDAPVTIGEYGATGGGFDIMPGPGDAEVLRGLIPMYEYDLLLNGGTEPLGDLHATPAG